MSSRSLSLHSSCFASSFPSLPLPWLLLLLSFPLCALSQCDKPPIIFNFGDSNSDTGGLAAGLGFPINPPYGRTFFGRSTGRLSDGRLLIDFLCQSLNTSFLSPYLESLGSSFQNGANFAVVGSSTLPKFVPFALNVQIMQFLHFKSRSMELVAAGSERLINEEGFRRALYMVDIGQNDLSDSFSKNLSYPQVAKRIPLVIAEIRRAVQTLYDQGGRNFWIHNTGPLGCLPQKLSLVQSKAGDLDSFGCISSYNAAAKLFNGALLHLCQEMKSELKDATIVYVDIYAIKFDIIANATKYGFSNPLMACCGFGGPPYNYNVRVTCGNTGSEACNDGARRVNWDGIHYTEAANEIVATKVLFLGSGSDLLFPIICSGLSSSSSGIDYNSSY
ncbi:hypothetical protein Nepgr_001637 [Nepenthes gracilis]|uniref:Uncharacterized protein n=1 Tax=Nepenthes gracilis TaxID=150966 RepID=A0AAD3P7I3_NEPGR|nr:hypothetical protein Nepgr_001637 [Nepenthes gracilis]